MSTNANNSYSSREEQQLANIFLALSMVASCLFAILLIPMCIFLAIAAKNLHNSMFHRVMRAPTRFFDITPIGKVLTHIYRPMYQILMEAYQ